MHKFSQYIGWNHNNKYFSFDNMWHRDS